MVSPNWDTIPFALLVPSNYDLGTTDLDLKQWVRWGFSGLTDGRFDIKLDDVYVSTSGLTLTSAAAQFTSDMVGKDVTMTGNDVTYTGTVNTYVSATEITVTPAVDAELISTVVSEAGSSTINGVYSFRGTHNAKPYYNLLGEPNSTASYAISNNGATWDIYNIDDTAYTSSDNPAFPFDVVTWTVDVGTAPIPVVEQYAVTTTIHGGAPLNAVIFDLAQSSYGANAVFSFNAQDFDGTHGIPPCFPNGSNQGGTGNQFPEPGDGAPACVWTEEIVQVVRNNKVVGIKAVDVVKGDFLIDRELQRNCVSSIKYNINNIYEVVTANGMTARVSDTHKFYQNTEQKLVLRGFQIGDEILTFSDGHDELTPIVRINRVKKDSVVQFGLTPRHGFLVGQGGYEFYGGIVSHNAKPVR